MGMTIEDLLTYSETRYQMKLVAGKHGWSNSISWMLIVEDLSILKHFTGKEVAVTTGIGLSTEEKLTELVELLVHRHASGLVINTGGYIYDIPKSIIQKCDEEDLPLITVPWNIRMSDMIKDISIRIFMEEAKDSQISQALINAIEKPQAEDQYRRELLPYFDVDGTFQVVLFTTGNLDTMDTVERRRVEYSFQIYLENLTHNANIFYYDSFFVLVINDVPQENIREIIEGFVKRSRRRLPGLSVYVGVGSQVEDITNVAVSFNRAKSAARMAFSRKESPVYFDQMGIMRLIYSIDDEQLTREMGEDLLRPVLDYDSKHGTNYMDTLAEYLHDNGSIQAVSEALFTHRNTILYRMNNIRKLLGCNLETQEERLPYEIACLFWHG